MDVDGDGIFLENVSLTYDDDYEYQDECWTSGRFKAMFIPVLYSLPFVVGVLGNGLLLVVLALKKKKSVTDTLILHLGIADSLLLLTLPFWAVQAARDSGWTFGSLFCKICGVLFNMNFYFGNFLLACVSLDFYLSIVHTTHMCSFLKTRKPWLVQASCLLVWLFALLLTIPDWIFLEAVEDTGIGKTQCVHNYDLSSKSSSKLRLASRFLYHIVGFLLPSAFLIYCYSCILVRLQRGPEVFQKQRAVRVILALVVVFFICWTPYNITLMVDTFQNKLETGGQCKLKKSSLETSLGVSSALGCLHACLNPLLYLCLCRNFRKRVLEMLRCVTVEQTETSFWELAVGEEHVPCQAQESVELKQTDGEKSICDS